MFKTQTVTSPILLTEYNWKVYTIIERQYTCKSVKDAKGFVFMLRYL